MERTIMNDQTSASVNPSGGSGTSGTPGIPGTPGDGGRCHRGHRRGGFFRCLIAGALLFGVVATGAYIGSSHAHQGGPGRHALWNGAFDPETAGKRIDAVVGFVLADTNADSEQKARIAVIAKGALQDLTPLRDEHKAARTKAVELLSAATIDRVALEQVRAAELRLAEIASRRLTQAMADAAEVLQPAQRARLAEKMQQRMDRRG